MQPPKLDMHSQRHKLCASIPCNAQADEAAFQGLARMLLAEHQREEAARGATPSWSSHREGRHVALSGGWFLRALATTVGQKAAATSAAALHAPLREVLRGTGQPLPQAMLVALLRAFRGLLLRVGPPAATAGDYNACPGTTLTFVFRVAPGARLCVRARASMCACLCVSLLLQLEMKTIVTQICVIVSQCSILGCRRVKDGCREEHLVLGSSVRPQRGGTVVRASLLSRRGFAGAARPGCVASPRRHQPRAPRTEAKGIGIGSLLQGAGVVARCFHALLRVRPGRPPLRRPATAESAGLAFQAVPQGGSAGEREIAVWQF